MTGDTCWTPCQTVIPASCPVIDYWSEIHTE